MSWQIYSKVYRRKNDICMAMYGIALKEKLPKAILQSAQSIGFLNSALQV